jgi:hypothetical protein
MESYGTVHNIPMVWMVYPSSSGTFNPLNQMVLIGAFNIKNLPQSYSRLLARSANSERSPFSRLICA